MNALGPLVVFLLSASLDAATPLRVNCGGLIYTDPSGNDWAADSGFSGASGTTAFEVGSPITGTTTPKLYQTERWSTGQFQYQFTTANGNYNVRLKFAEIYFTQAGQRMFHVQINGTPVLTSFDILAQAGASNTAVDRVIPVTVTTGTITIVFVPVTSNPKISAIEIVDQATDLTLSPVNARLTPNQQKQFTANVTGNANTGVSWTVSPAGVGTISAAGLYTAPSTVTVPQTISVTATSQADGSKTGTATVALTPAWQSADIGSPNAAGSDSYANGAFTVNGAGDIYGGQDSFHFVYIPVSGDFSFTARYNPAGACCDGSKQKVGIMYRQSLAANSVHSFVSIFEKIVALEETRQVAGNTTFANFGGAGFFWIKLIRQGTVTGWISSDGASWIQIPNSPVFLINSGLLGFAVSSGNGPAVQAVFDNITFSTPRSVWIDESLASMGPGESWTFAANTIPDITGPGVTVNSSISPNIGTLDPVNGIYTAPASIPTPRTVTLTATNVAEPNRSGSVVINLGQAVPVRVNAGGPAHIDPNGVYWHADTGFQFHINPGTVYSNGTPITNTTTPYLYQSEHFGPNNVQLNYNYVVPSGKYNVKIKLAEIFFTAPNQRVMAVSIGPNQIGPFDLFTAAGGAFKAYDVSFLNYQSFGHISIVVTGQNPKINAIEITPAP